MGLNISKGNMYEFITHTWNTVKGECEHDCSYCFVKDIAKRFNSPQKPVHFDEKELKTNLGSGNFIFVGSSNDMFSENIPEQWIEATLAKCEHANNKYLFQTKNPKNIRRILCDNSHVCVTLETNRFYPEFMGNSPKPVDRVNEMKLIRHPLYITIEPIMDFDLPEFIEMIKSCNPLQVNIGADSGNHGLTEPSKEKVVELIHELRKFTTIHNKQNLKRLISK